jgi:hypothetical protein
MPQRRKQQKGAGLFDILSSDPAKKIIANNKRISELEKESEQKCDELKKKIDIQIGELKKKNEELQKAADAKKAEEANSGSGFSFSKITDLFGSKSDAAAKPAAAAAPAVAEKPAEKLAEKLAETTNEEVRPAANPVPPAAAGDRMFGGKKSKRRRGSKARKSAKK